MCTTSLVHHRINFEVVRNEPEEAAAKRRQQQQVILNDEQVSAYWGFRMRHPNNNVGIFSESAQK